MGRKVARAHNELGWHWWPAPLAIATRRYGALNPCVQRATCLNACADGAKGSVDRTHWPRAIELGVELITNARVRTLTTGPDGLVSGAIYLDADGARARGQGAGHGAGRERHRHAAAAADLRPTLANSSGLVGKRLMMHPFGTVVGLFEDDLGSTQGPWGQHLHSLEFYETDAPTAASSAAPSGACSRPAARSR